ncbi:hypothetical protein [Fluviispira multicolorata]|uniref:Porin n=1 Tax=Fluviispira multicolorata TaxID=2654512 RepID=A0A833JFD6_9BACT|nr:hypothetical protein [Fluviispira multicolorata]KAB8033245.1 hypothetical protein GCL57_00695 [Fluviispira multicolorata]
MKRKVIRTLTISALSLVGSTAFAQETTVTNEGEKVAMDTGPSTGGSLISQEQIDALKKEVLKKDPTENLVKAYGLIQLNGNLYDSTRNTAPDFSAGKVRFGIQASGGIATGQFEVQFNGNQPKTLSSTSSTQGDGAVTIRRAQLNLDVLNIKSGENTFLTTLSLGGIRIGGADSSAPDAAIATNGYARQDGAYIKETITLGKKFTSEVGVGLFNNISAFSPQNITNEPFKGVDDISNTIQTNWGSKSFSRSVGFAGNAKVAYNFDDDKSLTGQFFYGEQANSPKSQNNDESLKTVRDVRHIEASMLYNDSAIFGSKGVIASNGVSVWYEGEVAGTTYNATANGDGFSYAPVAVDDSTSSNLIGVGLSGDTGGYLTGMLQKGDRLTYGVSYAYLESLYANQANGSNYKLNQYAASVGYAVNTFEVALVADLKTADQVAFYDGTGRNKINKNAASSYITAMYSF